MLKFGYIYINDIPIMYCGGMNNGFYNAGAYSQLTTKGDEIYLGTGTAGASYTQAFYIPFKN